MLVEVGERVVACKQLIEGDVPANPDAAPCEDGWVHCEPGDEGVVLSVDDYSDGARLPTVRFERTGTATLCFPEEFERCGLQVASS